jgi:UDP-N-acetylmuramoylalanine--D-glutamate ligase
MTKAQPLNQLAEQSVVILGFGDEGWSTYQLLRDQFAQKRLAIADKRSLADFPEEKQVIKHDPEVELLLGDSYLKKLDNYDVIFKTPGIPQSRPEIQQALKKGAKLSSNTQLFFELCSSKIIGVTGTKGKSTTAAVIHHVLKEHGLKTVLAGNIGTPVLSILEEIESDTLVVLELSSHQLATMTISPQIAVVQEITSEHLDYYDSTEEYQAAKTAITRYQTEDDLVIYDPHFEATAEVASLSGGQHLRHSLKEGPDSIAFLRGEQLMYRDPQQHVTNVIDQASLPLAGRHNLHNVLPAIIVGSLFGISPEEISEYLLSFKALPHRLELIAERKNVRYYDDSLATNPHAACQALNSFDEPLVLIAGGYERDQDFSDLADLILAKNVAGLVLFEPTGKRLAKALEKAAKGQTTPATIFTQSMKEAVAKAQSLVPKEGGVVLMSPASASFGLFENYHDRGLQFQQAVKELID